MNNDKNPVISKIRLYISTVLSKIDPEDYYINCDKQKIRRTLENLFEQCYLFVRTTCISHKRDKSHGLEHMLDVTLNGLHILFNDDVVITVYDIENIIVCCMLHDVADHKYDKEGILEQEVKDFLDMIIANGTKPGHDTSKDLWNCLSNTSYSLEKKLGGHKNVLQTIKPPLSLELQYVNKVVSDADRLEAIGKIGAERCILYTQHLIPDADLDTWKHNVKKHAEEKLYRLPFPDPDTELSYFHTKWGKKKAVMLHEDTMKYIQEFLESE